MFMSYSREYSNTIIKNEQVMRRGIHYKNEVKGVIAPQYLAVSHGKKTPFIIKYKPDIFI